MLKYLIHNGVSVSRCNLARHLIGLCTELHQVSLDEGIYLTIHHTTHVTGLVIGAMILHTTVVKDITAYLASPFYLLLTCLHLGLFSHSVL